MWVFRSDVKRLYVRADFFNFVSCLQAQIIELTFAFKQKNIGIRIKMGPYLATTCKELFLRCQQKIYQQGAPIFPFSWLLIEETSISKNSNSGRQLCKSRVLGYMEGLLYKATAPRLFRKNFDLPVEKWALPWRLSEGAHAKFS